jgi:hypothetical protein
MTEDIQLPRLNRGRIIRVHWRRATADQWDILGVGGFDDLLNL